MFNGFFFGSWQYCMVMMHFEQTTLTETKSRPRQYMTHTCAVADQ